MSPIILAIAVGLFVLILAMFLDRIVTPWIVKRTVDKVLKNDKKLDPRLLEKSEYGTLLPDNNSLQITNRKGENFILPWSEVQEILVFKRDLFAVDLICIAFKLSENKFIEINEEMVGYHDLQSWLPKLFSGIREDWFLDVTFPAFAKNQLTIWKK